MKPGDLVVLAAFVGTWSSLADPSSLPYRYWSRYTSWLERKMPGYIAGDASLIGVETLGEPPAHLGTYVLGRISEEAAEVGERSTAHGVFSFKRRSGSLRKRYTIFHLRKYLRPQESP